MNGSPLKTTAEQRLKRRSRLIAVVFGAFCSVAGAPGLPADSAPGVDHRIAIQSLPGRMFSLCVRNTDVAEVMEMLARKARINILLSKDVGGVVSVNLYDVDLDYAIRAIAGAAGYGVESRKGSYLIVPRDEIDKHTASSLTEVRTFKVQYSDPGIVQKILETYLSAYGKITILPERKLLIVQDLPEFLNRMERLLAELDVAPKQILIEAKILEITLDDSESFGLDWAKLFKADDGQGSLGVRGLALPGTAGLFLELAGQNIEIALDALHRQGRVRTLSTPKLLALENQNATVVIGDRLGYRLTTTINQVTTESIDFLESGTILNVRPSVDGQGRIMMQIHPEVSTGTISDGLPNQTTTEVTTQLLVEDGQTIFIGGLIKDRFTEGRSGVPVLGDLPLLGHIFSNREIIAVNAETVVLITPYIVGKGTEARNWREVEKVGLAEKALNAGAKRTDEALNRWYPAEKAVPPAAEENGMDPEEQMDWW